MLVALIGLWGWAGSAGHGNGKVVRIELAPGATPHAAAATLEAAGLIRSPWLMTAYLTLLRSGTRFADGEHLLLDSMSPRDIVGQLARLEGRPKTKITIVEGWHHRTIAPRLEAAGICSESAFIAAVTSPLLLSRLGIVGDSAEGYLFPATYDLPLDSAAEDVVVSFVKQARDRLSRLRLSHKKDFERMEGSYGFDERALLTMASIIEKETGKDGERARVAGVFMNRLSDPTFKPQKMLQSDPTAAYGCVVEPERAQSCRGFAGKVRPAMLRDADNRYNTYRQPGLPPGPICNPGMESIKAALNPEEHDYFFFVADGKGGHVFSETFDEHQRAIQRR